MKDRFKLRAVNVKTKEIIYIEDLYWFEEEGIHNIDDNGIARGISGEYHINQCTGKKDCIGKLIYDNDIISIIGKNGMKFTYIVRYSNTEYKWILIYNYSDSLGEKARDFYKQYVHPKYLYKEGYRVIGNIYENPELLEENNAN